MGMLRRTSDLAPLYVRTVEASLPTSTVQQLSTDTPPCFCSFYLDTLLLAGISLFLSTMGLVRNAPRPGPSDAKESPRVFITMYCHALASQHVKFYCSVLSA